MHQCRLKKRFVILDPSGIVKERIGWGGRGQEINWSLRIEPVGIEAGTMRTSVAVVRIAEMSPERMHPRKSFHRDHPEGGPCRAATV